MKLYSESYRGYTDSNNDLNLHGQCITKTIEEPPEGSFILLLITKIVIPATVKSRCKLLNLKKLSDIETLKVRKMNFPIEK